MHVAGDNEGRVASKEWTSANRVALIDAGTQAKALATEQYKAEREKRTR